MFVQLISYIVFVIYIFIDLNKVDMTCEDVQNVVQCESKETLYGTCGMYSSNCKTKCWTLKEEECLERINECTWLRPGDDGNNNDGYCFDEVCTYCVYIIICDILSYVKCHNLI
jgi:hypothetical protein